MVGERIEYLLLSRSITPVCVIEPDEDETFPSDHLVPSMLDIP